MKDFENGLKRAFSIYLVGSQAAAKQGLSPQIR